MYRGNMINSAQSVSLCSEAFVSRIIPLGVEQQARGVALLGKTPVSLVIVHLQHKASYFAELRVDSAA